MVHVSQGFFLGGGNSNVFIFFHPEPWGKDSQFDEHTSQRGCFNHHLVFHSPPPKTEALAPMPTPLGSGGARCCPFALSSHRPPAGDFSPFVGQKPIWAIKKTKKLPDFMKKETFQLPTSNWRVFLVVFLQQRWGEKRKRRPKSSSKVVLT